MDVCRQCFESYRCIYQVSKHKPSGTRFAIKKKVHSFIKKSLCKSRVAFYAGNNRFFKISG